MDLLKPWSRSHERKRPPSEPDNEWHCSQYPGCECFAGCREKALERQREPLDYFEEGIADALGYYNEKRVRMPGFNDSGRCVMSGIKYEKLTGKDLIAALRGGACGDLLEDAAYAAADEIERLQKLLQKIMARCADLLDEDQFNEIDAMVTGQPSREIIQQAKECGCGICDACVAASRPR
jgi:hypothetical protein